MYYIRTAAKIIFYAFIVLGISLFIMFASTGRSDAAWQISGPSSWYGGPCDGADNDIPRWKPNDRNKTPGIAMLRYDTILKLFLLKGPNGRYVVVQHTDYGPASWTGKLIDLNYTAVVGLGYPGRNGCMWSYPSGHYVSLRKLTKREASWWSYKTKTRVDNRWVMKKLVAKMTR